MRYGGKQSGWLLGVLVVVLFLDSLPVLHSFSPLLVRQTAGPGAARSPLAPIAQRQRAERGAQMNMIMTGWQQLKRDVDNG